MFSGKSTSLLNEISKFNILSKNILVLSHSLDFKRTNEACIMSHNSNKFQAFVVNNLNYILNEPFLFNLYKKSDIIIIDEAQFFPDLYDFITVQLHNKHLVNKIFIVAGLSGDSNLQPIGSILQLIPQADEVIKLNANCIQCKDGSVASFSKRKNTENKSQVLIGNNDIYEPVCRFHYYN